MSLNEVCEKYNLWHLQGLVNIIISNEFLEEEGKIFLLENLKQSRN